MKKNFQYKKLIMNFWGKMQRKYQKDFFHLYISKGTFDQIRINSTPNNSE